MNITDFQVRKDQLTTTRIETTKAAALADGQVRIDIAHFALTSNNITYAAFGDAMNYWRFFPVEGAADASWGRIPVWGFGIVGESRHAEVPLGERIYGYFPMATSVVLTPGKITPLSFTDTAPHRAELHAVYNQYTRTATDPFYTADTEGVQAVLRPLFITSWLIDDFLADNAWFGAAEHAGQRAVMLLSSASSKTAYGTAFQMAQREGIEVVGLTSAGNVAFCESLGCYHRVLTYEQLETIAANAPCVYVDFAGNATFRKAVHTHCKGLVYSSSIGGTHVNALGGGRDLPGPKPTLFFAPAQIKKRSMEWSPQGLNQRLVQAWQTFAAHVSNPAKPWLQIQQHVGADAVRAAYTEVLAGRGDPRLGHMLTLQSTAP